MTDLYRSDEDWDPIAEDVARMSVMDRLLDHAPSDFAPAASPSGTVAEHGANTGLRLPPTWEGLRQPKAKPRQYRGDELAAQMALRPRTGDVSPATPRRLTHSFRHCCNDNTAPGAVTPEAA